MRKSLITILRWFSRQTTSVTVTELVLHRQYYSITTWLEMAISLSKSKIRSIGRSKYVRLPESTLPHPRSSEDGPHPATNGCTWSSTNLLSATQQLTCLLNLTFSTQLNDTQPRRWVTETGFTPHCQLDIWPCFLDLFPS